MLTNKLPLLFALALSANASDICSLNNEMVVLRKEAAGSPNYFFRIFPDSQKVSYADSNLGNMIFDLVTGETIPVPGPYDPVPSWDEAVITSPFPGESNFSGMRYYSIKNLIAQKDLAKSRDSLNSNVEEDAFDENLTGTYQSVAEVSPTEVKEGQTIHSFGIITDKRLMRYFKTITDGNETKIEVEKKQLQICSDIDLKLPMISKNGKEIAGINNDQSPRTTKIYKIEEDGSCTVELDLGYLTGKVDFSFDNEKIVFHKAIYDPVDMSYFSKPNAGDGMGVFIYDRKTKKTQAISNNFGGNSYFPVFNRIGQVAYIDIRDDIFQFVIVDPRKASGEIVIEDIVKQTQCETTKSLAVIKALQLGDLWSSVCAQGQLNDRDTLTISSLLSSQQCHELIEKNWDHFQDKKTDRIRLRSTVITPSAIERYGQVTKEDLLGLCSAGKEKKIPPSLTKSTVSQRSKGEKLLRNRCLICHSLHFESEKDKILERINSLDSKIRMPKGSHLSLEQIKDVTDYLASFRKEISP